MLNRKAVSGPWGMYQHESCFEIRNGLGDTITYIHFDAEDSQKTGRQKLCKVDAQEVALAFLRVPELMGWK